MSSSTCYDDNMDTYIPEELNNDSASEILEILRKLLEQKYARRFRKIYIVFKDICLTGPELSVCVELSNNSRVVKQRSFKFNPYSDYWDKSDYDQHLSRTLHGFVDEF